MVSSVSSAALSFWKPSASASMSSRRSKGLSSTVMAPSFMAATVRLVRGYAEMRMSRKSLGLWATSLRRRSIPVRSAMT